MISRLALRNLARRFVRQERGVAAVELALVSPFLLLFTAMIVDLGVAYNIRLKIVAATSAAAQYAYVNSQSLTSTTVAAFLTNVQNVVKAQAGLSTTPTVTVTYNNVASNANFNNFYCLSGYNPVTWTSTGTSSTSCGGNVNSGKFVRISVSLSATPVLSPFTIGSSAFAISDDVIVRVR